MTTDDFQWREYYDDLPTDDLQREYTWYGKHIIDVTSQPAMDDNDLAHLANFRMHFDILADILRERNAQPDHYRDLETNSCL